MTKAELQKELQECKSELQTYKDLDKKVTEKFGEMHTLSRIDGVKAYFKELDFQMAIKALEQQPCEDAVSREDALDILEDYDHDRDEHKENAFADARARMVALPPVTPIRPKGEWEYLVSDRNIVSVPISGKVVCKKCGHIRNRMHGDTLYFCPHCGADMRGKKDAT